MNKVIIFFDVECPIKKRNVRQVTIVSDILSDLAKKIISTLVEAFQNDLKRIRIFRRINISYPLIRSRTYAYQGWGGVRDVNF